MDTPKSDKKYEFLWKLSTGWYGSRVFSKSELANLPNKFRVKVRYNKFYEAKNEKSAMFVMTIGGAGKNEADVDIEEKLDIVLAHRGEIPLEKDVSDCLETIAQIRQLALAALNNPQIEPKSQVSYGEAVKKGIDKSAGKACYDIVTICDKLLKG